MTRPLSPKEFDKIVKTPQKARILWTAQAIASKIGCTAEFVTGPLAREPGSPIRKIGGRWCADEDHLLEFFKFRPD